METLIVERSGLGGQASITQGIENFPGFPMGIGGKEFAERVVQQARFFDVEIRFNTVVQSFEGKAAKLNSVRILNQKTGHIQDIHPAAAFIFIGQQPNSAFLKGHVKLDPWGFILTGHDLEHEIEGKLDRSTYAFETNVAGVFAAGDVRRGRTKQVASAVGEGATVALMIREYLRTI